MQSYWKVLRLIRTWKPEETPGRSLDIRSREEKSPPVSTMERNPTKDSTSAAGTTTGPSSSESWTDNYSSSTAATVDPLVMTMYERWNNSSWTATMSGLFGSLAGRPTSTPSLHSLIQVTPSYLHGKAPPARSISLAYATKQQQQQQRTSLLRLDENRQQQQQSHFHTPSVRSHATAKSKESEKTLPLSNLTKHVRARRKRINEINTIEEGEDSSNTEVYTTTKESSSPVVPKVVVGQDSDGSSGSSSSEMMPAIPTVRGVAVPHPPVLAPECQHQPLTPRRSTGPLVPSLQPEKDPRRERQKSTEPSSLSSQQQQPSPEKRLVAEVIAASLQLPAFTRAPAVSSPTTMDFASPPFSPSVPSPPTFRPTSGPPTSPPRVLHQPRPVRPDPGAAHSLRPNLQHRAPDAMDAAVRWKIASLRQSLLTERPTIQPSLSVDAPETSPCVGGGCAASRPDAPSSSSSVSATNRCRRRRREKDPETCSRPQGIKAPNATGPLEHRTPTHVTQKKTSLHSLVYTSCSEDEDEPEKTPKREPSCSSSPKPCSTILESTLIASPVSNLTTDMRLIAAAHQHAEEKKQAEQHDEQDNSTTRAIISKTKKKKQTQKPSSTTIPSMRLVDDVRLRDPYGDMGVYSGVLVRNKPESHGTMRYDDGRTYTGSWKRGRWHGYGKAVFANGDSYMGEYEADVRNGIGRYEWADGRVFDGRFDKDQREGSGTYSWPDGSVYAGNFHGGLRHGSGTFTFADGSVYSGDWENGKQHGTGECVWKDGRCYRGTWVKGRAHGYGIEVRADGSLRHEGQWKLDRPVRSSKQKDQET